jgi:N-acetylneuraminate lyase
MVAPLTPFTQDGEVNFDAIGPLARLMLSRGAEAFYLCGGTGEGMSMRTADRMTLVAEWVAALPEGTPAIVHVGSTSLRESRQLAEHAATLKVAGISSLAPPFPNARDLPGLVRHLAAIAAAAPDLPFYYYHNSDGPGPRVRGIDFLHQASSAIPSLCGLKFTHEDLMDLSQCLRFQDGRYSIFYGRDQMLLGAIAVGARCGVGGTYNVLSPLVVHLMDAFDAGRLDEARVWNDLLVDAIDVFRRSGGLSAVKAMMSRFEVDCGPMQLPLPTLTAAEAARVADELERVWPDVFKAPKPKAKHTRIMVAPRSTESEPLERLK